MIAGTMLRARVGLASYSALCSSPEWIYPHGIYATREEAKTHIIEYIEMFYNSERVHQALDYRTPNEWEAEYFDREMVLTPTSC